MLFREDLKQIVRLLFINVFVVSKSVLTVVIHEIYRDCFSFFENLLFRSKQKKLNDEKSKL